MMIDGDADAKVESALNLVGEFVREPGAFVRKTFEKKGLKPRPIRRSSEELDRAEAGAAPEDVAALDVLAARLDRVNRDLIADLRKRVFSTEGVSLDLHPIRRVGLYVPRRMPSTAYTYLSAARAAGVDEICVYLAEDPDGHLDPLSVIAARRYDASVYGGPARLGFPVLGLGLRDEEIDPCDLLCGPCGRDLNLVKQVVGIVGRVPTEMWAGPSNLAVVADASAEWGQVLLDLSSQLEHGPDSVSHLILVGPKAEASWKAATDDDSQPLPERLQVVVVGGIDAALAALDRIAPETTEIWTANATEEARMIRTSGVVYVRQSGSAGDYGAAGRGCADPTDGLARGQSGLSRKWCDGAIAPDCGISSSCTSRWRLHGCSTTTPGRSRGGPQNVWNRAP